MSTARPTYDAKSIAAGKSGPMPLRVNKPGDAYEQEADQVASSVISGRPSPRWSISDRGFGHLQRQTGDLPDQQPPPQVKPNNYSEGAEKLAEAFIQTDTGKKILQTVTDDPLVKAGEDFLGSLTGKIITGAAAVGTVSGLAASHKALPVQIPAIPLGKISPKLEGASVKITYEGPVDHPTQAMITFSYTPGSGKKKKESDTDRIRGEVRTIRADQEKFRAGITYAPGTPQALQQEADQKAVDNYVLGGIGKALPGTGGVPLIPPAQHDPDTGLHTPTLESRFTQKTPKLLDQKLDLKPMDAASQVSDGKDKKEETSVQRKPDGNVSAVDDPVALAEGLQSSSQPLDRETQRFMESRIGHDFSKVKIHTDAHAAESAKAMGALAYAVGDSVVFGAERYNPHSTDGRRLLAHELSHVVQQTRGGQLPTLDPHHPTERDADRVAGAVAAGSKATTVERSAPGVARAVPSSPTAAGSAPGAGAAASRPGRIIREFRAPDGNVIDMEVGDAIARMGLEDTLPTGTEVSLEGWQRAHQVGPGLGAESGTGIRYAPPEVNLKYQNSGIERFIRDFNKAKAPDVRLRLRTVTTAHPNSLRLERITYRLSAVRGNGPPKTLFETSIEIQNKTVNPRVTLEQPEILGDWKEFLAPNSTVEPPGGGSGASSAAGESAATEGASNPSAHQTLPPENAPNTAKTPNAANESVPPVGADPAAQATDPLQTVPPDPVPAAVQSKVPPATEGATGVPPANENIVAKGAQSVVETDVSGVGAGGVAEAGVAGEGAAEAITAGEVLGIVLSTVEGLIIGIGVGLLLAWLQQEAEKSALERDMRGHTADIEGDLKKSAAKIAELQKQEKKVYARMTLDITREEGIIEEQGAVGQVDMYVGIERVSAAVTDHEDPPDRKVGEKKPFGSSGLAIQHYLQSYSVLIDDPQKRALDRQHAELARQQAALARRLASAAAKQPKPAQEGPKSEQPLLPRPDDPPAKQNFTPLPGAPGPSPYQQITDGVALAKTETAALILRGEKLISGSPSKADVDSFLDDERNWRLKFTYIFNNFKLNGPDYGRAVFEELLNSDQYGGRLARLRQTLGG
jgi:hypothetical protein